MKVFKVYFKILRKQLLPVLIYCGLFLAFIILISVNFFNEGVNMEFKETKVRAAVFNQDKESTFIDGFLEYLGKRVSYVEIEDSDEARSDALFFREAVYIITIPEGFTEAFIAGENAYLLRQTVPDSTQAFFIDNVIDRYLNTARIYLKNMRHLSPGDLSLYINHTFENETNVSFDLLQKGKDKSPEMYNKIFFNYLGYIMLACFIIAVSTVMISFHSVDIRRRHSASPITSRTMNFELILSNVIFVMVYTLVLIAVGYVFNPYRVININTLLYWANAGVFAITVLSISYLIGIAVKSKKAISALSTALSLGLAFISGMFVPQELLGDAVIKAASFTPSYWYVRVNGMIGTLTKYDWDSISEIAGSMVIQMGFTAAIFAVALVVSKKKRQLDKIQY